MIQLLALWAITSSTVGPEPIRIDTVVSYVPTQSFTWSSDGAIEDSGTMAFLGAHWGGIASPAVGALQLVVRLLGAEGSLDLRLNLVVTGTATPGVFLFEGPWSVRGGSGDYAGVSGSGMARIVGRVDQQSTAANPELGVLTGQLVLPKGILNRPSGFQRKMRPTNGLTPAQRMQFESLVPGPIEEAKRS